jgi:radical SAM protein with 4Fe4S-binding SPASM domain
MNKDLHEGIFIDFDLFKKIIDSIVLDRLKSTHGKNENFNLTFHGGEPTTIDKTRFFQMCEYARDKFLKAGLHLLLSIQTNLTLIDEEWCQLFNRFNVSVGASWDGTGSANEARTDKPEDFYYEKSQMLNKYNVQHSFLLVVNRYSVDYIPESLQILEDKFHKKHGRLNYVEDVITPFGQPSTIEVPGREFFEKVIKPQVDQFIATGECFDGNVSHSIEKFMIDYLTNIGNTYPDNGNCYIKYCGSGINVMEIDPDGSVLFCGRYGDTYEDAILMHVLDDDFLAIKQITKHLNFQKAKIAAMNKSHCDSCRAQNICDHGCMAYHYTKPQADGSHKWGIRNDLTCAIFKPFYDYLFDNANEIFESYLSNNVVPQGQTQLGLPPLGDVQPTLSIEKIRLPLERYSVQLSFERDRLIFTSQRQGSIGHVAKC